MIINLPVCFLPQTSLSKYVGRPQDGRALNTTRYLTTQKQEAGYNFYLRIFLAVSPEFDCDLWPLDP